MGIICGIYKPRQESFVWTKKCLLTNCNKNINEVPNRIACMCFERSKGIQKCRWNKKPKCIGKVINWPCLTPFDLIEVKHRDLWLFVANRYVETGDGLVFRSGADQFLEKSSKRCENQNWDYKDQIVCSNGYLDGSLCRIEGTFGILSSLEKRNYG